MQALIVRNESPDIIALYNFLLNMVIMAVDIFDIATSMLVVGF